VVTVVAAATVVVGGGAVVAEFVEAAYLSIIGCKDTNCG